MDKKNHCLVHFLKVDKLITFSKRSRYFYFYFFQFSVLKWTIKYERYAVPYLKHFLIQDSGAEDGDALCVDDGPVASGQRPGHPLLTVHDDGDALLLHADGHTMPPEPQRIVLLLQQSQKSHFEWFINTEAALFVFKLWQNAYTRAKLRVKVMIAPPMMFSLLISHKTLQTNNLRVIRFTVTMVCVYVTGQLCDSRRSSSLQCISTAPL